MNDCVNGDIRDVLPELVSGTLPAGDVARVQSHVRECGDCAAEVELLRTACAAMRLVPTMDTTRIASVVQASTAQRLAARRVPARVARYASLSLLVMLGAIGVWSARDSSPSAAESRVATPGGNVESGIAQRPVQLALGGDMTGLEDDQLVTLLDEISELEAMPGEAPSSLAIEPVLPVAQEEL